MPRAQSAQSDASADAEGMQESELEQLRNKCRLCEGDRNAFMSQAQDELRRQDQEISQLEREQKELNKDIRLAESQANQAKDEHNTKKLNELLEKKDDYLKKIKETNDEMKHQDEEIREWEKKTNDHRKKAGGSSVGVQHSVTTDRKIKVLENRLSLANTKFNDTLTKNAHMRDEINNLCVEKKRFEQLHKKLEKELTDIKREIGEVIDSTTQAYDSREEAEAKMILLREKAEKDVAQHNADRKELLRVIDHESKLRDFMGRKGQEREEDEEMLKEKHRKEVEENNRRQQESGQESVDQYERAFTRIQELTRQDDLDQLVTKFIEGEDRNFALYNYVSEENNRIEQLHFAIEEIKDEMDAFKQQGSGLEDERHIIIQQLEERQLISSKQAEELEKKSKDAHKILEQLRAGIESMLDKINCDRSSLEGQLGSSDGVTFLNMIQYLGIVEQRTNELLAAQAYIKAKENNEPIHQHIQLLGKGPAAQPPPIAVIPPSTGDDLASDDSDDALDENKPLTRAELQSRVMKTVKKREEIAQKEAYKYDLSDAREKTKTKGGTKH